MIVEVETLWKLGTVAAGALGLTSPNVRKIVASSLERPLTSDIVQIVHRHASAAKKTFRRGRGGRS